MTESQTFRDANRRRPYISHEELRRHLLAADEECYRLRNELRAVRHAPASRQRGPLPSLPAAVGLGTVLVAALAGGLLWQMCRGSVRADDRPSVRIETTTVTPRLVVAAPTEPRPATVATRVVGIAAKANPRRRTAAPRPQTVSHGDRGLRGASVPRPLSPGEFGRQRLASS
jgi:hypothetical protein